MTDTSLVFDLIARDRASRTVDHVGGSFDKATKKVIGLGLKGGTALATLTAATGLFIVKAGAPYVSSLNKIQALSGANDKTMASVARQLESNAGLYAKMGQTTGDAASGVVELVKAGQTLSEAMQSVHGTMVLAKAGELSVADASNITANALNTFHLKAKKAGDIANYLANAANISSADVSDIAESLKYVAPVAASAGVSIEQTNAVLAELANAGIKGSSAGTALRTMLLNLQAPTSAAATVLKDLGIKITDASGDMKPFPALVGALADKLKGVPGAQKAADLKALFGNRGIAAAQTILANGVKGLEKYTKGVEKAGAAQKLANAQSKGLAGSFQVLIAGAKSGAQSIYRQFSPIADKVLRPLATKFANFAGDLGPRMSKGLHKLSGVFDKLDLSGVGKSLAKQARGWATPVISGFNTGLNTGDWSGLGKALGNGIVKAGGALGSMTAKFGAMFSKIDWVGIGITVGKQAPSFLVGLATGLLNFDLFGLLKGVAKHWQDVLLAVIALAFTPGRIVGKVGELLARIPLVGKLLEWGLLAMKKFSDKLVGAAFDALKFLGKGFLRGFRSVFPDVGAKFAEELGLFPTRVGVMAIDLAEKGLKMVRGLGKAIAKGADFVAAKIGELIGYILRPWVDAGSWLIRKGVAILSGLIRGIASKVGDVLAPMKALGGKILSAVGNLGKLLWNSGVQIIQGLLGGIDSMIGKVTSKISSLGGKIKGVFSKAMGIFSPSRVFRGYGVNLIEGLVKGIDDHAVPLQRALDAVVARVKGTGQRLQTAVNARNQFASGFQSFASSAFGADYGTDANGNPIAPTAASIVAYQQAQAAQAQAVARNVKRLVHLGLSPALLKQLQAGGSSGIAEITALASATPAQIRAYNAANKATTAAYDQAGMSAGNRIYGDRIHDARREQRQAERLEKAVRDLADAAHGLKNAELEVRGDRLVLVLKNHKTAKGGRPLGLD